MIEQLIQQFSGSDAAQEALSSMTEQGIPADKAAGVLSATVEGAAESIGSGETAATLGGLLGGGNPGVTGALGGLLGGGGGGGLGGMIGGLLGGGGLAEMTEKVVALVVQKTGLSEAHARTAVGVVLPKIMEFVKSKAG